MAAPKGSQKPAASGRKKGTPNKVSSDVRQMVLNALNASGGEKYLVKQAEENPKAFLTLVAKVIPKEIDARVSGMIELALAERIKNARERVGRYSNRAC